VLTSRITDGANAKPSTKIATTIAKGRTFTARPSGHATAPRAR
jgi:hypothetical protein